MFPINISISFGDFQGIPMFDQGRVVRDSSKLSTSDTWMIQVAVRPVRLVDNNEIQNNHEASYSRLLAWPLSIGMHHKPQAALRTRCSGSRGSRCRPPPYCHCGPHRRPWRPDIQIPGVMATIKGQGNQKPRKYLCYIHKYS